MLATFNVESTSFFSFSIHTQTVCSCSYERTPRGNNLMIEGEEEHGYLLGANKQKTGKQKGHIYLFFESLASLIKLCQ